MTKSYVQSFPVCKISKFNFCVEVRVLKNSKSSFPVIFHPFSMMFMLSMYTVHGSPPCSCPGFLDYVQVSWLFHGIYMEKPGIHGQIRHVHGRSTAGERVSKS